MAYFYIGMSHYNLKNWNKAIDSLSLVGTEVSEEGAETTDEGEDLGQLRSASASMPRLRMPTSHLRKLGQPIKAIVQVSSGDKEIITGARSRARSMRCSNPHHRVRRSRTG